MELIVDTSVVVAAILRSGNTRNLIFNSSLKLYSPERVQFEIMKNKEKFKKYANYSDQEFEEVVALILKQIEVLPFEEYKEKEVKAKEVCKRDETDWPFVALALKLVAPIWTSDPDLLKGQDKVSVLTTEQLVKLLIKRAE